MTQHIKVILKARPLWLLLAGMATALVVGLLIPTAPGIRGPLLSIENTILIAVLVGLGVLVGNLYIDRGQLYARIAKLETDLGSAQKDLREFRAENGTLRDTLAAAASFINRIGWWVTQGCPPGKQPRPPEQLDEHIDAELWDNVAIGGSE